MDAECIQRDFEVRLARAQLVALRSGTLRTKRVLARLVRAHVQWLLLQDMPLAAMARAAGLRYGQLLELKENQDKRWIDKDTALAILDVEFNPAATVKGLRTLGALRRIQSLRWRKWKLQEIARESGVAYVVVANISSGSKTSIVEATDQAIREFFEGNRNREGGARQRGCFPPPEAWDGAAIDDPTAVPCLMDALRRHPTLRVEVREFLDFRLGRGEALAEAAGPLGVTEAELTDLVELLRLRVIRLPLAGGR